MATPNLDRFLNKFSKDKRGWANYLLGKGVSADDKDFNAVVDELYRVYGPYEQYDSTMSAIDSSDMYTDETLDLPPLQPGDAYYEDNED